MDVFGVRDRLVSDYKEYTGSFVDIHDKAIREHVEERMTRGYQWPDPWLSLNPSFASGGTITDLVRAGLLQPECEEIFRLKDSNGDGPALRLHQHQREAIEAARSGGSYVLTTGTGSGKSLTYIIPIVDRVLAARAAGTYRPGIKAIVVYPMNALANSQLGELEKFLKAGFPQGPLVSFARYTGQESGDDRKRIIASPPDILLTNYVMLELVLTRPRDRGLIDVELPLTPEQGRSLASSGVVTAVPSPYLPGYWQVSAAGKVGAARIGAVEVHIRPKVGIGRLLFLAGYAQSGVDWLDSDVQVPEAGSLVPVIAQILWRQTQRAIHQGLLPGYVVTEESSPVLRGRLREADQLRRHHGLALPLEIRYDEFTTDIAENRILRAAAEHMLTVPGVDPEAQRMLRRLLRSFADVTLLSRGDPIPAWEPTRLNARYHSALRLAELILRAASVEHGSGGVAVNGFLLDMPRLFEDFVTVALREFLVPSHGGRVDAQSSRKFDEAGRVTLRPDILWLLPGQVAAVADAKYKAEKPAGYPNADLYQLLAYCTVLGLPAGYLIYAKGNEEPVRHVVRQSATEIVCHAIDLEADPAALLDQLRTLADQIAAQADTVLR